jgi:hypothetical protein
MVITCPGLLQDSVRNTHSVQNTPEGFVKTHDIQNTPESDVKMYYTGLLFLRWALQRTQITFKTHQRVM